MRLTPDTITPVFLEKKGFQKSPEMIDRVLTVVVQAQFLVYKKILFIQDKQELYLSLHLKLLEPADRFFL